MSTRSSISFVEYEQEKGTLHLYRELMDNKIYLEDGNGRIEIPEEISEALGKVIDILKEGIIK